MSATELLEELLRSVSSLAMSIEELRKNVQSLSQTVETGFSELRNTISAIQSQLGEIRRQQEGRVLDREYRLIADLTSTSRVLSSHVAKLETMLTAHREFVSKLSDTLSTAINQLATIATDLKDLKTLLAVLSKQFEDRVGALSSEVTRYRDDLIVLLEELRLEIRRLRESIDSLKEVLTTMLTRTNLK